MSILKKLLAVSLFSVSGFASAQAINWTVSIQKVHVSDDTVKLFVEGPSAPNPNNATWGCTSNLVSLGGYSDPIPATLKFSTAMEAYKLGVTTRIGVEGSGANCILTYITINDKI